MLYVIGIPMIVIGMLLVISIVAYDTVGPRFKIRLSSSSAREGAMPDLPPPTAGIVVLLLLLIDVLAIVAYELAA